MCEACATTGSHALLAKQSPGEDDARRQFLQEFIERLRGWHVDVLDALADGLIIVQSLDGARRGVRRTLDGDHDDGLRVTVQRFWTDTGEAGRAKTARRFDLDIADDISDRVARELRNYGADAWDETSSTMVLEIAEALRDAHDNGIGVPEMERILRDEVFPQMRGYEAERLARTSATGAANRGAIDGIRDAGAPGKRWLATGPPYDRTRESHEDIDGQVVPVGSKFTTGAGNQAWWPGDPRLPPQDFIMCRCGVGPAWSL